MKRNLPLFTVCLLLLGMFPIVLLTGLAEHHPPPSVHSAIGLLLMGSLTVHLLLHRNWIANVLRKYNQMPAPIRRNVVLDLVLLLGFIACGSTGLLASASHLVLLLGFIAHGFPGLLASAFHVHLVSLLHGLCGLVTVIFLVIHLKRHWKWIQVTWKKMLTPDIGSKEMSGSL